MHVISVHVIDVEKHGSIVADKRGGGVLRTIQSLSNRKADRACIRVALSIAHALHVHRIRVGTCMHKYGLAPGMLSPEAEVTSDTEAREVRMRPL